VTAPAGFGKSHLFRSLFARLYSDFIDAKRSGSWALRPLPLLPEYLASAAGPTLRALVASFLSTEVARPLSVESFEWMLTHGYACFLLDGLDEVIARDPHFFEYLYELVTRSDVPHPPKILICVRDSLLVSNKGLRDFLDEAGHELVARHRLAAWQRPSVEAYVRRNLDPGRADALMRLLGDNENLLQLAGTPFFCEVLTSEVGHGIDPMELTGVASETRLLALATRRMVQREFDNGMLQPQWASPADIESLIQDIAEENLEGGAKGVRVDDVAELAKYSLASDLQEDENEMENAIQQVQQLPFFTGAVDLGRLSFSQEVIYDYLLGLRAADYFASNPKRFLLLLGVNPISSDSAMLHVIRERILGSNGLDDLYRAAMDAAPDRLAFRNVLQVILSLPGTEWIVRRLPLERGDLSALRFADLDLSTVSFRGSNLEAASFENCSLRKTVLADAVLKDTSFHECTGLDEIDFGDLSTFFSGSVDGKMFEEPDGFLLASGAARAPGVSRYVQPCAAANQLRFLFGKYVRPDGAPRRDWLDEKAVVAGRRFVDPKPVVEAARRYGYLEWDSSRKRYLRSRGDSYSDMVGLVSKLQITPKIRLLLSDVCNQQSCSHLLEVGIV
jgi:Pentapeptide repeats (9 copies)